jgi:hypothetical protein
MLTAPLHLLRLFPFLCGGHRQLALENLALRHQLAVYKRTVTRPRLRSTDRLCWVGLARLSPGWKRSLGMGTPETVLRWQRRRFPTYWTRLSGRRPPVGPHIRALVVRIAQANPLWGAPRIHGELQKLWIEVAERTVSRLLPKRRTLPGQVWRTFLANHVRDLSPSISSRPPPRACVGALRPHGARSPSPTHRPLQRDGAPQSALDGPAARGRLPERRCAIVLLRDRDTVYGPVFRLRVERMEVGEIVTALYSTGQ